MLIFLSVASWQSFLKQKNYSVGLSVDVLFCRVADNSEVNQMTASNLSLVFGPTLFGESRSVKL